MIFDVSQIYFPCFMMLRFTTCLVTLLCFGQGCERRTSSDESLFHAGIATGALDNPEINEASGLAASRVNPGMLWTHNDSRDTARIFLIDSLGRSRATVFLEGIHNRDWEDIAVGPGPELGKSYIYIGDIGDNEARYPVKYIYRIEEPVFTGDQKSIVVRGADSIKFTLPGRIRDTEALMIDPQSKDLYIFSKREHGINLYTLPYPQSTTEFISAKNVLSDLPFSRIVAADWSADGTEILIKDYEQVYYWKRTAHEPLLELIQKKPAILPYEREPQGESIAFDLYGKGYYTVSESIRDHQPELIYYRRSTKKK